eukprot:9461900-Ditylum_brightwellii.AAC.1
MVCATVAPFFKSISAFSPDLYDDGDYVFVSNCGVEGIEMYVHAGRSCNAFDSETIFSTMDNNDIGIYLNNLVYNIEIVGSGLSFQNPVHFILLVD